MLRDFLNQQAMGSDWICIDLTIETPQETPELVPDGETPQNVAIVVFDDLVNQVMTSKFCWRGKI